MIEDRAKRTVEPIRLEGSTTEVTEPSSRSSVGSDTAERVQGEPVKKRVLLQPPIGHDDQHQLELAVQRKLRRRQRVHRSLSHSSESSGDDDSTAVITECLETNAAIGTCAVRTREAMASVNTLRRILMNKKNVLLEEDVQSLPGLCESLSELALEATRCCATIQKRLHTDRIQEKKKDESASKAERRPSWKEQLVEPKMFSARKLQLEEMLLTRCPSWDVALRDTANSSGNSPRHIRRRKHYTNTEERKDDASRRVREEDPGSPRSPLLPLPPPPPILPSDIHDAYSFGSPAMKPAFLYSSRQRALVRRSRSHGSSPQSNSNHDDDNNTVNSFSSASFSDYDDRLRELDDDAFTINIPDEPSIRSTSTTPRETVPSTPRTSESTNEDLQEDAVAAAENYENSVQEQ